MQKTRSSTNFGIEEDKDDEKNSKERKEGESKDLSVEDNKDKNRDSLGKDDEKDKSKGRKGIPLGTYFILGNEFCERYSFYAMQSILTLFLNQELHYSETTSSSLFHSFMALAYFTPLLGGMVADSWLGSFYTIFYISILYAAGNVLTSIGSMPLSLNAMRTVSLTGLLTVAFGTGGIKPCVSAFGGDQFKRDQASLRKKFYSLFYFSINVGSMLSTVLSPVFRARLHCFGKDTCYPVAFGVPAVLFLVALAIFLAGKRLYKIKEPKGSILIPIVGCVCYALVQKVRNKAKAREHWLDYANDKYDQKLIDDIKDIAQVIWITLPLPVFWTLYEQQGSKWILQGGQMDGNVGGGFVITPDQMQILNPVLILCLIPIFDYALYPVLMRFRMCRTELQRIVVGMLLCAVSFLIAGFVSVSIESHLPPELEASKSELKVINNSPCNLRLIGSCSSCSSDIKFKVSSFEDHVTREFPEDVSRNWTVTPESGCPATEKLSKTFQSPSSNETMMVTLQSNELVADVGNESKVQDIGARVRVFFSLDKDFEGGFYFRRKGAKPHENVSLEAPGGDKWGRTEYTSMPPGEYEVFLPQNDSEELKDPMGSYFFKVGGNYVVVLFQNSTSKVSKMKVFSTVDALSVHILWQVAQAVVLTSGEVMFNVPGLEFCYAEAPENLKSVSQSIWLMTSAVGNMFVVIIDQFHLFKLQSNEFFMYSGLMVLTTGVFATMAHFYVYKANREKEK